MKGEEPQPLPTMPRLFPAPSAEDQLRRYGERYKWWLLVVITIGNLVVAVSMTGFYVASPTLMAEFGVGQDAIQWAYTGYLLAAAVSMLSSAWLIERVGLRRCYLGAVVGMALASLCGAFSPNLAVLVAARMVLGFAGGFLMPMGNIVTLEWFAPSVQGRVSGLQGMVVVLAPAVAPALGGVLIDHFGWQAIFLMNLPCCIVAALAGLHLLPATTVTREIAPLDGRGLALLTAATVGALLIVESLPAPSFAGIVLVAGALLALRRHLRRCPEPLFVPALFRFPPLLWGGVVGFVSGGCLFASTYLVPVFLQTALGYSPSAAGAVLVPAGLMLACALPLGGWLCDRQDARHVTVAGLLLFAAPFASLWLAARAHAIDHLQIVLVLVSARLGLGLLLPAPNLAALRGMHGRVLAQSSMLFHYARQMGGVLGVAAIAAFVQARTAVAAQPLEVYGEAFLAIALMALVSILPAWRMRETPLPQALRSALKSPLG